MNKTLLLFLLAACALTGCGQPQNSNSTSATKKSKIGLVFDVGGRGDKSFNDAAFSGLERAKKELDVEIEYIEPGEGSDREAALRQLASQPDVALVFGIGFIFTDDITDIAKEYPDKKFACIDYTVSDAKPLPKNLSAVLFREEEGSFLVGAIAAMTSKSGMIGFVGGMESPLIKRFLTGYRNGAEYVRPNIVVLDGYAGLDGNAFKNPARGKELALGQYNRGADIIYHASGVTGLGVFEAARETKKFAIGVDMNQENEAPGLVLTSMVKMVDNAVFQTVAEVKAGKFQGGTVKVLGLEAKGVDYVYNETNKNLISDSTRAKAEELRAKLVSGAVKVGQSE
ncbi:MAG: BMP family ABC transporter substrate-binding protein [Rhizobacter sp.]|nr:BMP family ABC transporter substrate-binding protein [Chlorobiales bacterium]